MPTSMVPEYDEYGRPIAKHFNTLQEFLAYADSIADSDFGAKWMAEEIRRNPGGWELSQGQPKRKEDWLARNLKWIGPAAVGGFGGLAALGALPGAAGAGAASASGGGAAAAGGILPSSHLPAAALMGGPGAVTSGAATGSAAGAAGAAGGALGKIGRGVAEGVAEQFNPWQQAALAALAGLPALMTNRGPSDEERGLYDQARQLTQLQQQRMESQNPLFDAVTRLAMSRLPRDAQGA